jgi:hypothetical protein
VNRNKTANPSAAPAKPTTVNSATPIRAKDKLNKPTVTQVKSNTDKAKPNTGKVKSNTDKAKPNTGKSSLLLLIEQRILAQLK